MRFSSTWSTIAAHVVLMVLAQPPGRYLYEEKNGAYSLGFDIKKDRSVAIYFATPTGTFKDGYYPLTPEDEHSYAVNFTGTYEGVHHWYIGIRSIYRDVVFHPGDLTTLSFASGDSLHAMFGGKRLFLLRQGYDLQVGTFAYTEGYFPFPIFRISYTVHASGSLDVFFQCTDIVANPVSFELAANDKSLLYKSYDLVPSDNVDKLKENVRSICPGFPFEQNDLTNVVFVDPSTIFIVLFGATYQMDKEASTISQ